MAKECKNYERNMKRCTCTYEPCSRKGYCCECMMYHWSMRELPACFFSKEGERTYDRSVRCFIAEQSSR